MQMLRVVEEEDDDDDDDNDNTRTEDIKLRQCEP